jgi:AGZA family xanthine/uracil permease-like MFS transporter
VTKGAAKNWIGVGDLNGFFGLAFDNLTVLSFLAGILIFGFHFPEDIVYGRMFPGTALGVFFGDLVYTWMAWRLAKRSGKSSVTAMPLGLDTPSTIGIALTVLGPAFITLKSQGASPHDAAIQAWQIGMATMISIGILKLILSFFGAWVQKVVPQAGLLGSLAGIGLALIGFIPLAEVFGMPLVGVLSLGLILYALVAHKKLPGNFPGVLTAIGLGTFLYYVLAPHGLVGGHYAAPNISFHYGFPLPTLGFVHGFIPSLKYLPIAIPFGLLTVVGGINVTESARVAGDDFNTRDILLTEAIATLIAGIFGGVAQSTPYIGQPAYKHMGSRAGYTLLTGIFIGLGGILGYLGAIVEIVPMAVIAPILIFVALDIICQAFLAVPAKHAPAVAFSYFPTLARLLQIKFSNPDFISPDKLQALMSLTTKGLPEMLVITALGNGFILTAMLWGSFLAELIDGRLKKSALYLALLSVFALFGVIHSASTDGTMYWPWNLAYPANQIPYQFASAYALLACVFFALSFTKASKEMTHA